jgi:hypothetical protein
MSVDAPELRDLRTRVEHLEKQNRRLKRAGLAVVVLVGSAAALGAAYARPAVPQKIVAHEFDVVDSSGRVRMRLDRVSLNLLNETGRPAIALINATNGSGLEFYGMRNEKMGKFSFPVSRMQLNSWGLQFADKDGNTAISLGGVNLGKGDSPKAELQLNGESPSISLFDPHGKANIGLAFLSDEPIIGLSDAQGYPRILMSLPSGQPSISLRDAQGFSMDLGSTDKTNARTGTTERTSAASIVMFGKDKQHHEIWEAPEP